jgi:hypothetical protein
MGSRGRRATRNYCGFLERRFPGNDLGPSRPCLARNRSINLPPGRLWTAITATRSHHVFEDEVASIVASCYLPVVEKIPTMPGAGRRTPIAAAHRPVLDLYYG